LLDGDPASLALELGQPTVFKTVPTKQFDGTPLSATEQARTKAAMDEARLLGMVRLNLGDLVRKSGRCTYTSSTSLGSNGSRVVLRTKNGKDRLDIFHKQFRVFAFPSSFDKTGVKFDSRASVGFFANVAASGPFSDGASNNIRIGRTVVSASGSAGPPPPTPADGPTVLRVPVLDESGELLQSLDASFPKTIELDGSTGPEKYSALMDKAEAAKFEIMRFASPNDYETGDPATTICFSGSETGVCDTLSAFTDNLLGDMFSIAQNDDEALQCDVTKDAVSLTFFMSESDSTSSATIPRCK
jgi:hypothetical protein